jgi:hypothetical protein
MAQENTWKVPPNERQWLDGARSYGLGEQSTIFDLDMYKSGPQTEINQFLLLRVLWEADLPPANFHRQHGNWINTKCYWKAGAIFKKMPSFERYLQSFKSKDLVPSPDLGTFSLVRYNQLAVESTRLNESASPKSTPVAKRAPSALAQDNPRREELNVSLTLVTQPETGYDSSSSTSEIDASKLTISTTEALPEASGWDPNLSAPTEDEEIVINALVGFLKAVTMHHVRTVEWTMHRKAFHVGKPGEQGFEARVDGRFRRRGGREGSSLNC